MTILVGITIQIELAIWIGSLEFGRFGALGGVKIIPDFFKRKKENSKEPPLFPPYNSLAASC